VIGTTPSRRGCQLRIAREPISFNRTEAIKEMAPITSLSDAKLVAAAVSASGLSARAYATRVLKVNERTVRRWLSGESEIRDRSLKARIVAYVRRHSDALD
jgi:hypothetical protein